jgi:hypothetical protein
MLKRRESAELRKAKISAVTEGATCKHQDRAQGRNMDALPESGSMSCVVDARPANSLERRLRTTRSAANYRWGYSARVDDRGAKLPAVLAVTGIVNLITPGSLSEFAYPKWDRRSQP